MNLLNMIKPSTRTSIQLFHYLVDRKAGFDVCIEDCFHIWESHLVTERMPWGEWWEPEPEDIKLNKFITIVRLERTYYALLRGHHIEGSRYFMKSTLSYFILRDIAMALGAELLKENVWTLPRNINKHVWEESFQLVCREYVRYINEQARVDPYSMDTILEQYGFDYYAQGG